MNCPTCKHPDNKVVDSRISEGGFAIRRRRKCMRCKRRFTTKERVEDDVRLTVIKSSGRRVPYDRESIVSGIERACTKLDVTGDDIEKLMDRIEGDIFDSHEKEITTEEIGRYVGRHLRRFSPVGYVRFMSVHRKFSTIDEFVDAITEVRSRAAREDPDQQPLFED